MSKRIKPTEHEIEEQIDEALNNPEKFSGMTYAEGVEDALRWVLGLKPEKPMED